jgi:hypothetical protein
VGTKTKLVTPAIENPDVNKLHISIQAAGIGFFEANEGMKCPAPVALTMTPKSLPETFFVIIR